MADWVPIVFFWKSWRRGYGNIISDKIFFVSKTLAYLPGAMQGLSISSKVQKSQQKGLYCHDGFLFQSRIDRSVQFHYCSTLMLYGWQSYKIMDGPDFAANFPKKDDKSS